MSNPERLEKIGRLEELKQRAITLSMEIHALRSPINRATDRTRPLDDINLRELAEQMGSLQKKLNEHRELCEQIKDLAEDLNVPMPATDVRRKRS